MTELRAGEKYITRVTGQYGYRLVVCLREPHPLILFVCTAEASYESCILVNVAFITSQVNCIDGPVGEYAGEFAGSSANSYDPGRGSGSRVTPARRCFYLSHSVQPCEVGRIAKRWGCEGAWLSESGNDPARWGQPVHYAAQYSIVEANRHIYIYTCI